MKKNKVLIILLVPVLLIGLGTADMWADKIADGKLSILQNNPVVALRKFIRNEDALSENNSKIKQLQDDNTKLQKDNDYLNSSSSRYDYYYITITDTGLLNSVKTLGYIKASEFSSTPTTSQMLQKTLTWTNETINGLTGQQGQRWKKIGSISVNDLSNNLQKQIGFKK